MYRYRYFKLQIISRSGATREEIFTQSVVDRSRQELRRLLTSARSAAVARSPAARYRQSTGARLVVRDRCVRVEEVSREALREKPVFCQIFLKDGISSKVRMMTYRSKNFTRRRHAQIQSCINWLYRNDLEGHHFELHDTWISIFIYTK